MPLLCRKRVNTHKLAFAAAMAFLVVYVVLI